MLRRLALKDFVIVRELDLPLDSGFSVLTGETGAGKSILVDALQLVLGARAESHVVREGATRAEISAEFDLPPHLAGWMDEAGFDYSEGTLLLRRVVDKEGKSRAYVNGSAATAAQLRDLAEHLVDIHGQHAWQGLTRPAAVRALLDTHAGVDPAPLAAAWQAWRSAEADLAAARAQAGSLESERERLAWQIGEVDRLQPGPGEWDELNAEHQRLAHAQALIDGAGRALALLTDDDTSASSLQSRAAAAVDDVVAYDAALMPVAEALESARIPLDDAVHRLRAYLSRMDVDPARYAELDARMSAWVSLARRYRRPPAELPELLAEWRQALQALEAAADIDALAERSSALAASWRAEADRVSAARKAAATPLSARVTAAMQQLGMAGGSFEVALVAQETPQAYGRESVELRVAGHPGASLRPLAKVASGGELSRLALAIAVTTAQQDSSDAGTLIFDEIDTGIGGNVADTVGRLMNRLGRSKQVLAVTHLPQVAACADTHYVVSKQAADGRTHSDVNAVTGEMRVAEVARMLGGAKLASTSVAHAQELINRGNADALPAAP